MMPVPALWKNQSLPRPMHTKTSSRREQTKNNDLAVEYMEPQAGTKEGSRYWNKRTEVRQPGAEANFLGKESL